MEHNQRGQLQSTRDRSTDILMKSGWNEQRQEDVQNSLIKKEYEEHLRKLDKKFEDVLTDIKNMRERPEAFKQHQLPLARIKKIMKSDEDVKMISAEAPILFAKACELFIMDLTFRAWFHTNLNKRKTLQKVDLAACISNYEMFDFLIDIIPRDEYTKNIFKRESANQISGNTAYNTYSRNFPFNITPKLPETSTLMKNPLSSHSSLNMFQRLSAPSFMQSIEQETHNIEDKNWNFHQKKKDVKKEKREDN